MIEFIVGRRFRAFGGLFEVHKALPVDKGIDRLRAENKLPAAK